MVTPEGRAKILDLGLAILVGEVLPEDPSIVGGEGYILGTMDYIAPEQSTNSTGVDQRADLYSLGCSMYFALSGVPPFPGGTAHQKMKWHREESAPPVSTLNASVPAAFSRLVDQLMAKRAGDRPPSAEAVGELLLPWASESVSRAGDGPHSVREAVVEIDRRTFDPSLWDVAPYPAASEAEARRPPSPGGHEPEPEDEPAPNWVQQNPATVFLLLAGGAALAIILLAILLVLLRWL
jgi:serine/threonine protein kinase